MIAILQKLIMKITPRSNRRQPNKMRTPQPETVFFKLYSHKSSIYRLCKNLMMSQTEAFVKKSKQSKSMRMLLNIQALWHLRNPARDHLQRSSILGSRTILIMKARGTLGPLEVIRENEINRKTWWAPGSEMYLERLSRMRSWSLVCGQIFHLKNK